MAFVLNDRVKETTTTTGTSTVNLAGAETGFESFVAGIGNSNTCYYAIVHQTADEFEVGLGTVTDATPDTLAELQLLVALILTLQLIFLQELKMYFVHYLPVKL